MELKKNTELVVGSNSSIYFAVGLVVMLSISYSLLEYRSYDAPNALKEIVFMDADIEDYIPITEQLVTPPPPPQPQAAPEIITIVEDIEEIQETY